MASEGAQRRRWIHDNFQKGECDYLLDRELLREKSWTRQNISAAEFWSEPLPNTSHNAVSSGSTASPPNSPMLRKWLHTCDKNHTECHRQSGKENFWPKRVIFVGDPNKLSLVEGQPQRDDYLVLSHCWGRPTPEEKERYCTTRENYLDRLQGFSFDELPKTFQDAVQVTRALQKQYLWIDALCIIQGPDGDWDSEAKTMADIFACAYCTIAASSARGWGDGFLEPLPDPRGIGVRGTPSTPTCACDFDKDVEEGALMKRAWVLQERVLSRRIIHFTAAHTYCECGQGILCEHFTKLEPPFGKRQYFILDPSFPGRLNMSGFRRTVDFIQFLFRKYSASCLTFETDRDVAIYSLVERIGQVLRTEVRYGIFRCFLGSLLLWKRTCENNTSPIPYEKRTVPSWSWMAYSGGIDFVSDAMLNFMVPCFEDLGFAKDGQALSVKVRKFHGNCRMEEKEEEHAIFDGTEKVGSLWFDVAGQIQFENCNCVVVGIREDDEKEDAWKTYHILMIREKAGGGGYERVGVGKVEARYVSIDCDAGMLW
ncbi:heterokaryon incompatibility protein-domain-containing protein [Achaetomium macrosporum]|uniref:Heterokaryon incompatibility protein-domain-containing protein n=1 Tax=Achaetomium macrosporum TaxID=79813 RepID=A0AAN7C4L8_9PEZI|nr:heterokaryon incompatibility protein-domain-containing protein [Achaetomium macrosporum]